MSAYDPQMKIRLPAALHRKIAMEAEANLRSMNGEVVARLEASFETPSLEEFQALQKWTMDFMKVALEQAVEQVIAGGAADKDEDSRLLQRLADKASPSARTKADEGDRGKKSVKGRP